MKADEEIKSADPPFDYCYEFSETRKVLEEFFTPQQQQQLQQQKLLEFQQQAKRQHVQKVLPLEELVDLDTEQSSAYIGKRLAALKQMQQKQQYEHLLQQQYENTHIIEGACGSKQNKSSLQLYENEIADDDLNIHNYYNNCQQSKNFTLSPETTDYDSNCGDLDSEFSLKYISSDYSMSNEVNGIPDASRLYSSMPVLEDGLSSGHASDTENNNPNVTAILEMDRMSVSMNQASQKYPAGISSIQASIYNYKSQQSQNEDDIEELPVNCDKNIDSDEKTPEVETALNDIRETLARSNKLTISINEALASHSESSNNNHIHASKDSLCSADKEIPAKLTGVDDEDTDLETDRLLGQQRLLEQQQGGFDDNKVFIIYDSIKLQMFHCSISRICEKFDVQMGK